MNKILIMALLFVSAMTLTGCKKEDIDPVISGATDISLLQ